MKRFLLPLSVFAVLLVFLGLGLRLKPQEIPSPLINKGVPDFKLPQVQDVSKSFEPADLRGKVWILNVWASWCASCRTEHPALLDFAKQGVAPIVGLDYMDTSEKGQAWLNKHGNPYQSALLDKDGKVGTDFGVIGVPETFVIDQRGFIRFKYSGPLTPEVIQHTLLPVIMELNRA